MKISNYQKKKKRQLFDRRKSKHGIEFSAKEEQLEVVLSVMKRRNVLGLLPTGFGKTLCSLMPSMLSEAKTVTLIISPLIALMDDQIAKIKSYGLRPARLGSPQDMEPEIVSGIESAKFDFVLSSPETAIKPLWKEVFLLKSWQEKICLLVIDEAHCISDWGEQFRPDYRHLHELRSLFDCPVMALTATSTRKVKNDILKYLHLNLSTTNIVSVKPNRTNVFLSMEVRKDPTYFESLLWMVDHLKAKLKDAKKTIVYCRSVNAVAEMFAQTKVYLGESAYVDGIKGSFHLVVEMFHNGTDERSKDRILRNFKAERGNLRCVFATVALGMGLDIADVDLVIHIGAPKTAISYWQEVGRCARDSRQGFALCVYDNLSMRNCEADVIEIVKNSKHSCIRKMILSQFEGKEIDAKVDKCSGCDAEKTVCSCKLCRCCSYCIQQCDYQKNFNFDVLKFLLQ